MIDKNIFSTTELEKEIESNIVTKWKGKWDIKPHRKVWWEQPIIEAINLTSQRLKKEVEKILDEFWNKQRNGIKEHITSFGKGNNRDIDPREKAFILMLPNVFEKKLKSKLGMGK